MKVFIANPHRTIIRSTDHDYVHNSLVKMSDYENIDFCLNKNLVTRLHVTANYIKNRLINLIISDHERLVSNPYNNVFYVRVPSSCNVIFSYGGYPIQYNLFSRKPVVCEQSYAFGGQMEFGLWRDYLRKSRKFYVERADLLVTPSIESMNTFREVFPQHEHKIRVIPYFLPYLKAIESDQLKSKYFSMEKIKILFVGKEARRKGLDSFVQAYEKLPQEIKDKFEVTVISKFLDGEVPIPEEFIYKSYVKDLESEYRKAHLLLFLTKREAYGLVLVEAMAAGCTVLTTDHPIQQSIMNYTGGWFVNPMDIDAIYSKLLEISETSQPEFLNLGLSNLENFISDKAPKKVSQKYFDMFSELS